MAHRRPNKAEQGGVPAITSNHPLDSEKYQIRLRKLMQWRRQARVAQADNRSEQAIDEDFYDGIQLEPEDLQILLERNQPPLTFNVVKNTINWLLGTERKGRMDFKVLPRKKEGAEAAKAKTKLLKYVQDVSTGEYAWSQAFTECICAGIGWMEFGVRKNGDEPIFERMERWRNMWYDHLALEATGTDMRYVIREKWADLDIAQAIAPDRAEELEVLAEAVNSLYPYNPDDAITDTATEFDFESSMDSLLGGPFDGYRQRVKLVECWYRIPDHVKVMQSREKNGPFGTLNGAIYRPDQEDHKYLVNGKYFSLTDAYIMTVRCAMWAGNTLLQDTLSPYNHNRFPFVPLICYQRKRDNMPYGIIRDLRDPQSDLNRRRSRALVMLTANRIMYEDGAFSDPNKAYDEFNRPDMMLKVTKDYIAGNRIKVIESGQLAAQHVALAKQDEDFIHSTSGVTYENQGVTKRELSGAAIEKLQTQGGQANTIPFDNLFFSKKNAGEIKLSLIEQFMDQTAEKRILGDDGKPEFININKKGEDGNITNDITRTKDDFVMSQQDYRETIRLSMLSTMNDIIKSLAQSMPEAAMALLDLLFELMDDMPNRDEAIARIRKINKQGIPDDEMTPEQKQQKQEAEKKAAEEAEMLKQLAIQMKKLEVAFEQSKAEDMKSRSEKAHIEAQVKKIEGFVKALEAAQLVAAAPHTAEGADVIIEESKKVDEEGAENKQPQSPQQPQQGGSNVIQ